MKFQSSAFTRIKLQIIPIILTTTFLLSNSTAGQALWGKKVKKISNDELTEIKTQLNLLQDPRFRAYGDSDLEDVLNKEMDEGKTPGLTYGAYILNAINEQNLVDLCSKSYFNDKDATRFFSALTDGLASWQENFAAEVTKTTLEAVIKVSGASGVSIGISSLFLALDLAKIQVSIIKLVEVISNRGLWHYIVSRKLGDPHQSAWGSAPVPIKYRNKQTEDYFKSLWGRYGKHMSEDGLDEDFKQQQREKLTIFLLYALGAKAHLVITSPLQITPSPSYYVGEKITAEFTITNKGEVLTTLAVLTMGGRDSDGQVTDFTFRRDITLDPNQSYNYKGTLTLAKTGKYHFFCAYQTPDGKWNTSIDLGSGLTDEDRVEDIIVKAKGEILKTLLQDFSITLSDVEREENTTTLYFTIIKMREGKSNFALQVPEIEYESELKEVPITLIDDHENKYDGKLQINLNYEYKGGFLINYFPKGFTYVDTVEIRMPKIAPIQKLKIGDKEISFKQAKPVKPEFLKNFGDFTGIKGQKVRVGKWLSFTIGGKVITGNTIWEPPTVPVTIENEEYNPLSIDMLYGIQFHNGMIYWQNSVSVEVRGSSKLSRSEEMEITPDELVNPVALLAIGIEKSTEEASIRIFTLSPDEARALSIHYKMRWVFTKMRVIADAIEMYFTDHDEYPTTLTHLTTDSEYPYISKILKDPFDSTGGSYGYYINDTKLAWLIVSNGPDGDKDIVDASVDFTSNQWPGELGGPNGATGNYYGSAAGGWIWSAPSNASDDGDIGRGGP